MENPWEFLRVAGNVARTSHTLFVPPKRTTNIRLWFVKGKKNSEKNSSSVVFSNVQQLLLGGGWTNPFEKYARQFGSFPKMAVTYKKIYETTTYQVIQSALFGMVEWPFGKVKWPSTRGWKGHGLNHLDLVLFLKKRKTAKVSQLKVVFKREKSPLRLPRRCSNLRRMIDLSSDQNPYETFHWILVDPYSGLS